MKRLLSGISLTAAATLALSGVVLTAPAPANAAAPPEYSFVFDSPSGTDWKVPSGVSEVVVGLRGGSGGAGQHGTGGRGADFAVSVPVTTGDTLTVYVGKNASGKSDERDGGAGFIAGGTGGKGSLVGANGGGGGGAAALKLNGELVAVAGGGGGGGGETYVPNTKGGGTLIPGGKAGGNYVSGTNFRMTDPGTGGGSAPGAVGANGIDDSRFGQYHKPGEKGGTAGFMTAGGGGGAGGAGWPASGTGGGGGRVFQHYSGGSGGGAGMSWVTGAVAGLRIDTGATRPEDMHDYQGPLADTGTAKIFIPVTTTTSIVAPQQVEVGQPFSLRVLSAATRTPNTPLDGWVGLYQGGARIDSRSVSGDSTFTIQGLPAGSYEFRADFSPSVNQRDFREASTKSTGTVVVEVVDPTPGPTPEPDDVESATSIELLSTPSAYGSTAWLQTFVALTGADEAATARMAVIPVAFDVDGSEVATGTLFPAGDGRFWSQTRLTTQIPAGTHSVVARFPGSDAEDPTVATLLPSESEPLTLTLERAATTTAITAAPSAIRAFDTFDVTAQVQSGVAGFDGNAVLLADGMPLMYADLDAAGNVLFSGVTAPPGTAELTVAYLGDTAGNYAVSSSAAHPIAVTAIATVTALEASKSETRGDESVVFTATVQNTDPEAGEDPRGQLELYVDGEREVTTASGGEEDPESGDGETKFEVELAGLTLGEHRVTARFVAAPGFAESESEEVELRVRGVETRVTVDAERLRATPQKPASAGVTVELAEGASARAMDRGSEGAGVEGYLQAFVDEKPLGEPVSVTGGRAQLQLAGLEVGTHRVELRFMPAAQHLLKSSATVSVEVLADADGGGNGAGPGGTPGGAKPLVRTGSSAPNPLALGTLLLTGAALTTLGLTRRRRG